MTFIAIPFIIAGIFFTSASAVGAIRLPDFYTRAHALGVIDTLGTMLLLTGFAFLHGWSVVTAKLILVIVFIFVANPTITHILFRAAVRSGLKPWKEGDKRSD